MVGRVCIARDCKEDFPSLLWLDWHLPSVSTHHVLVVQGSPSSATISGLASLLAVVSLSGIFVLAWLWKSDLRLWR